MNTGNPATTSKTWFAYAQDGGSGVMTTDGGQNWFQPKGIEGLQHAHGNANLLQIGNSLFVTGTNNSGTFRSTDLGRNWTRVSPDAGGVVWGSTKGLYFMWGWACSRCGLSEGGPQYHSATWPGDNWKKWMAAELPAGLVWGPNSVAATNDGKHNIYVGSMWSSGLWRYVEP